MSYILTFSQFVDKLDEHTRLQAVIERHQTLAGIKRKLYAVVLLFTEPSSLLLEQRQYQQFKKSNNWYAYDPENPEIPIRAHYHVYPSKSKAELYAVNVDGTAHHKANRGHQVPRKEADELRMLGVKIPSSNILEGIDYTLTEGITGEYNYFIIHLDE